MYIRYYLILSPTKTYGIIHNLFAVIIDRGLSLPVPVDTTIFFVDEIFHAFFPFENLPPSPLTRRYFES